MKTEVSCVSTFTPYDDVRLVLTDRQDSVVLDTCHAQIFDHSLDFGIPDVGSIDMADEVESRQHWDESNVNLPKSVSCYCADCAFPTNVTLRKTALRLSSGKSV